MIIQEIICGWTKKNTRLEGAYYVDRDFNKARDNALKAIPFLRDNPSFLAETLRGLMIDHAHLNDLKGYKTYETEALDAVYKGTINAPMDVATIYEGIGNAKTQFGDMDAIFLLEEAEKEMQILNEKKKNRPVIHMQIHRTKLEYLIKMEFLGLTLDQRIVNEFSGKAKDSIKTLPEYTRHKFEINSLINRLKTNACQLKQDYQQMKLF